MTLDSDISGLLSWKQALKEKDKENTVRQRTSESRPEPVVVTVQEPVQDPGENCAVVDGGRGQAETRRDERGGKSEETPRGGTTPGLWLNHRTSNTTWVIVIN